MGSYLNVERGPEQLVSAEEAGGGVQLQRGFLLKRVPSAAFLALFGGADLIFGLHLVQHGAEHFALEATQIQRGNGLTALDTQQRDLWGHTCWGGHAWLLGPTDKTLIIPLCRRRK